MRQPSSRSSFSLPRNTVPTMHFIAHVYFIPFVPVANVATEQSVKPYAVKISIYPLIFHGSVGLGLIISSIYGHKHIQYLFRYKKKTEKRITKCPWINGYFYRVECTRNVQTQALISYQQSHIFPNLDVDMTRV